MAKFEKGRKVRTKLQANIYASEDPPSQPPKGRVPAGVVGNITLGPHMGKSVVRFETGESGWVSNGDLEIID